MRKILSKMFGVTLLEVLLVLVIASLVLVMSIRYYQTASNQAKVNASMETLSGIMSSVDSYLSTGPVNGTASVTDAVLANYLPNNTMPQSPFGGGQVKTASPSATSYQIVFPTIPASGCSLFIAAATQNGTNPKVTATGCVTFTITP